MADWMAGLSTVTAKKKLSKLYIPGSENACSYSLNERDEVAGDLSRAVRTMASVPLGKETLSRWMKHQNVNVETQLLLGVRYLSTKVAARDGELFSVNGLYGAKLKDDMHAVHRFLLEHPKEVVLLHFLPVAPFARSDFDALTKLLRLQFDDLVLTQDDEVSLKPLPDISLHDIWRNKRQVILLCDGTFSSPLVWQKAVARELPGNDDIDAVEELLEEEREDDDESITVLSCAVSLALTNVLSKPFGNFEKEYGRPATRTIEKWLNKLQNSETLSPCVISAHFVDEGTFCESVIQLNH